VRFIIEPLRPLMADPAQIDAAFKIEKIAALGIDGRIACGDAAHAVPGRAVARCAGLAGGALDRIPETSTLVDPQQARVRSLVGLQGFEVVAEELGAGRQRLGMQARRHQRDRRDDGDGNDHSVTVRSLLTVTTSPRPSSQVNTSSPDRVATVWKAMKGLAATPWVRSIRNTSSSP